MDFLVILVLLAVVVVALKFNSGNKKNGNVHDRQLSNVKSADFSLQPVMNASESNLYDFLLHMVNKYHYPVRVFRRFRSEKFSKPITNLHSSLLTVSALILRSQIKTIFPVQWSSIRGLDTGRITPENVMRLKNWPVKKQE